ncbi:hypothetical protein [Salegentibacter chungangensis]|uniref:Capsular biosynthesis protein n=1 Tax=Salegentibacter chungangensis TaxID=1335724 RepID=A0ABW3NUH6_9FLAO
MKLIFCFAKILRNSHLEIFELDKLVEKGYDVTLLDLTKLHGGQATCDNEFMNNLITQCNTKEDIIDFVGNLGSAPVIYVCNDEYLTKAFESLKLLVRDQDKVLGFRTKTIPVQHKKLNVFKRVLRAAFRRDGNFYSLFQKIYKLKRNYLIPDYFLCSTNYDLPLKIALTLKKQNIIIAHADDVNKILKVGSFDESKQRIGVFLDQLLPIAYQNQLPDEYFDHYYEKLRNSLNKLKDVLDLEEIIIAEHPESEIYSEKLTDKFKGYTRVRGRTNELIKSSSVVFAHFSTSIGFAAFYKKPIVILNDRKFEDIERISLAMASFVDILNLPVIDMDSREAGALTDLSVDNKSYDNYIKKFLKDSMVNENSYHYAIKKIHNDISVSR